MFRVIKKSIPVSMRRRLTELRNRLFGGHATKSYAQEGEDLVLARILDNLKIKTGFFVDIGAHHPTRFSNTYYFYKHGWRGINVDALPGTRKLFERMRSRDITVECGVGEKNGISTYFRFDEPALNTFSEQEAKRKNTPPYHMIETLQVPVVTLKQILDEHLPTGMKIDFMTIDVEGLDYEVICSNDWALYRPHLILIELLNTGIENLATHPIARLLRSHDYRIFAKTYNTFFFVANEVLPQAGQIAI